MRKRSILFAILFSISTFIIPLGFSIVEIKVGDFVFLPWVSAIIGSLFIWAMFIILLKNKTKINIKLEVMLTLLASPVLSYILVCCFSNGLLVLFNVDELFELGDGVLILILQIVFWIQIYISQLILLISSWKNQISKE